MRIGILTAPYRGRALDELLPKLAELGVDAVELGTGNHLGDEHCPLDALLNSPGMQAKLLALVEQHGMTISALSQHGNPLHPARETALAAHETWRKTVELAAQLGVPVVNAFSGCPGDSDSCKHPNWVSCAWPPEYLELLAWQWDEKVIPYWREEERYASRRGIKVAIEMHPGFVVYEPTKLLRLRAATGDSLGANFDPSHLLWQGIDPLTAIELLAEEDAIFHVHAKDTELNRATIRRKGLLDVEALENVESRSWSFRTLGIGHGEQTWRQIINGLRKARYDYVVSIEHEDERLETDAAIAASIRLLQSIIPDRGSDISMPAEPATSRAMLEVES
jgi:sugar phosphate isomerase/epimerase